MAVQIQIPSVALTGGPCGGKTLGLAHLGRVLEADGWRVFTVPEMATLLYSHGVRPEEAEGDRNAPFRLAIMQGQLSHEVVWREMARISPEPRKVILQDRGLFDELPYTAGANEFERHLRVLNLNMESALARYDLVIHMVSIAVDVPEAYSLVSNPNRRENPAKAAKADAATWNAWSEHPCRYRIANRNEQGLAIDFQEKIASMVSLARRFLANWYS